MQGEHGAVAEPVEGRGVDLDYLFKLLLLLPAAVLLRSLVGERVFDPPFFKNPCDRLCRKVKALFLKEAIPTYGLSLLLSTESVPVGRQSPEYVPPRSLTACRPYCRVSVTQLPLP